MAWISYVEHGRGVVAFHAIGEAIDYLPSVPADTEGFATLHAWNRLVALEGAGNGHIDLVGTSALVLAAWALARERRSITALVFALAVGIKLLPCVLAPHPHARRLRRCSAADGA